MCLHRSGLEVTEVEGGGKQGNIIDGQGKVMDVEEKRNETRLRKATRGRMGVALVEGMNKVNTWTSSGEL